MSKGSNRRPAQIPDEQLEANWNKIFRKDSIGCVAELVQDKGMEGAKVQAVIPSSFMRVLH